MGTAAGLRGRISSLGKANGIRNPIKPTTRCSPTEISFPRMTKQGGTPAARVEALVNSELSCRKPVPAIHTRAREEPARPTASGLNRTRLLPRCSLSYWLSALWAREPVSVLESGLRQVLHRQTRLRPDLEASEGRR